MPFAFIVAKPIPMANPTRRLFHQFAAYRWGMAPDQALEQVSPKRQG